MTYNEFIQNILNTRGRHGIENEYYERHHILARCCGGTNEENNLIDLFAEEHYTAHKLLAEEHPNIIGLQQAFACMSFMKKDHYRVTCEEYAAAKKAQAVASSVRLKNVIPGIRKGIPCSEETKEKLRQALKGKNLGKKHSEETRKKIGQRYYPKGSENHNYGKPLSDRQKQILSEKNGIKYEIIHIPTGEKFIGNIVHCAEWVNENYHKISKSHFNKYLLNCVKIPNWFKDNFIFKKI